MKRLLILSILLSFLLTGCFTVLPGQQETDPTETKEQPAQSKPLTGWVTEAAQTFYVNADGSRHTGWLDTDGKRYYLDDSGVLQTGWLELDGKTYYLQSDGSVTKGVASINNSTHHFTAAGEEVLVVNPWNFIRAKYTPKLVEAENGYKVASSCKDSLLQMLADCRAAGNDVRIISAYRTHETQIELYNNKVLYYINRGYDDAAARTEAAKVVATPGTSEHQLGLALDLVDGGYRALDEAQENTPAQKWLMEHCWEYGFILRYPSDKSDKTGIIYEPWHYRFVGKELATELKTTGQCLEEYFENL